MNRWLSVLIHALIVAAGVALQQSGHGEYGAVLQVLNAGVPSPLGGTARQD